MQYVDTRLMVGMPNVWEIDTLHQVWRGVPKRGQDATPGAYLNRLDAQQCRRLMDRAYRTEKADKASVPNQRRLAIVKAATAWIYDQLDRDNVPCALVTDCTHAACVSWVRRHFQELVNATLKAGIPEFDVADTADFFLLENSAALILADEVIAHPERLSDRLAVLAS